MGQEICDQASGFSPSQLAVGVKIGPVLSYQFELGQIAIIFSRRLLDPATHLLHVSGRPLPRDTNTIGYAHGQPYPLAAVGAEVDGDAPPGAEHQARAWTEAEHFALYLLVIPAEQRLNDLYRFLKADQGRWIFHPDEIVHRPSPDTEQGPPARQFVEMRHVHRDNRGVLEPWVRNIRADDYARGGASDIA